MTRKKKDTTTLSTSVVAFKFGKKKSEFVNDFKAQKKAEKLLQKDDHEMRSYVYALEQLNHLSSPWVTSFFGEDGEGILSQDNEERHVS
jgi:hypothetical protein